MKLETFEGRVVNHRTERFESRGKTWSKYIVRFAIDDDKCSLIECRVKESQYADLLIGKYYFINAHMVCNKSWINRDGKDICIANFVVDGFSKSDKLLQDDISNQIETEAEDADDEKLFAEFLEFKRMMQNKNNNN